MESRPDSSAAAMAARRPAPPPPITSTSCWYASLPGILRHSFLVKVTAVAIIKGRRPARFRMSRPEARLLDLVPAQLVMQSPRADPEKLGGFLAVRRNVRQHLSDDLLFDGAEGKAQRDSDASLWWRASHERRRQVHSAHRAGRHGDDEPLHEIAELPNIARPRVLAEDLEDGG